MNGWFLATDPQSVHQLLEASDQAVAGGAATPPRRDFGSTER